MLKKSFTLEWDSKASPDCVTRVSLLRFVPLDPHLVCLEDEPIHTVTGLVKQWLRELPDPLMTFTLYNDFLHAVGVETLHL